MLRFALLLVLFVFLARAFWRLVDGIIEGLTGRGGHVPARGTAMVRDPVCGTYILPDRAVTLADRSRRVYFCSATCRDKYQARTA